MLETRRQRQARRLDRLVRGFQGRRVAVLGDLVVDEFVQADIERISREAPVLILQHRRTEVVPGGGANSAANLRALGAVPLPVGLVGKDQAGSALLAEFARRGIPSAGVLSRAKYTTPTKSRILAGGVHTRRQQIVRLDRGSRADVVAAGAVRAIERRLLSALDRCEGLLVADYGYGAAAPQILQSVLDRCRERRLPVTVDSRSRVAGFPPVTACTPNQEEIERALGLSRLEEADLRLAGQRMLRRTRNQGVLVTCGARGMILFERRRKPLRLAAYGPEEVADVTGAGDTVISTFTLALVAGASLEDAARLSNYAAGIVVAKAGTATVTADELLQAVEEDAN